MSGNWGEKLYLDNGTLTPMLKKMESAGFLTRVRNSDDERVVMVHLTQKGHDLRRQAKEIPKEVSACLPLSPEDARLLYQLLYRVLLAL